MSRRAQALLAIAIGGAIGALLRAGLTEALLLARDGLPATAALYPGLSLVLGMTAMAGTRRVMRAVAA